MAVEIISAKITPQPVSAGARVKITVGLKLHTWDVYSNAPYYDFVKTSGTWTKAQLHDDFDCNGADSASNYSYSINHETGAITLNVTNNGWKWAYVSYLDDGWGVWQQYGVQTSNPTHFFRNESGSRQTSPYSLVKYTAVVISNNKGTVTGNIVTSFDDADYPADGYDAATNLWYVKRQE